MHPENFQICEARCKNILVSYRAKNLQAACMPVAVVWCDSNLGKSVRIRHGRAAVRDVIISAARVTVAI